MLILADARRLPIRDACVQCVITSPPYWGLRSYPDARQIGLEPTPEAYVAAIVAVFAEVRRVLCDDGTAWLNLGDSYSAACSGNHGFTDGRANRSERRGPGLVTDLKPKDLVGIPWRVAFALQADGWYLRSDIIWSKPNPMPESVTDRPTKAHEYLFLLTKSERYHYDAAAIQEPLSPTTSRLNGLRPSEKSGGFYHPGEYGRAGAQHGREIHWKPEDGRNKRSVWTIPTSPYSGAHFATFPEKLIEPCILAGCPVGGMVLDPFIGSGTVGTVCERLGRRWVGTDLSYQPLAQKRTAQRGLRW